METSSLERTSVSLVPEAASFGSLAEAPRASTNPIWVAFVAGLLALALALGYALGHVIETRWAFMP